MKIYKNIFQEIISAGNLFQAWEEFKKGKQSKPDVAKFERDLEENLFSLHRNLAAKTYKHGPYKAFYIQDPKQRLIHKATVRDRVLHHAIFNKLNPIFEPTFYCHSFSCRKGRGTHKGVDELEAMLRKVSANGTRACFALKCDIKKFFQSVEHGKLLSILATRIKDAEAMWLLEEVITSFTRQFQRERERERAYQLAVCRLVI